VLLGKALTAHIVYPKIAADFRVKGLVLIRLTLHPDGQVSDIELVRSSSADVLDQEALRGARAIATIPKVNIYLKQPKSMVVGLLFS
jgi:TonB family protein